MTNNTDHIGHIQQLRWWRDVRNDPSWFLYLMWFNGAPVGYGIIRIKDGRHWVTGGIVESARGHGHGRWLFSRLTEKAGPNQFVYLEVLRTNQRAINLYRSLGYRFIGEPRDGVLLMRTDPG